MDNLTDAEVSADDNNTKTRPDDVVIDLWDLPRAYLIVLDDRSSYVFSNQVGGTACEHPRARGVLVPFYYFDAADDDAWYDQYITARTRDEVDLWLRKADVAHLDPRAGEGGEAWIPVRVGATCERVPHLAPFVGREAILTYENSD